MTVFLGYPSQNVINYLEEKQCFWLEAEEDGLTISLVPQFGSSFPPNIHISISRDDRQTWTTYDGYVIENLNKGDRVYFRAGYPDDVESFENERICGWNEEQGDIEEPITFVFNNKKVGAHGNLNCLLQKYGRKDTLASYCYAYMFEGCKSLTSTPELPAQTLAEWCYGNMFNGCTSLTKAPKLPVTTLAEWCYGNMFNGCTSLTKAPELPATTLANSCYYGMFYGCTSLTKAPELPATTLANSCYCSMFQGCTSLTSTPKLPATTLANNCYSIMFQGCTSLTSTPKLPATTLATNCYHSMFKGCTSLTQAPRLLATTLTSGCYSYMFHSCKKLSGIEVNYTAWSPTNATINWVNGVSSTGTFKCPSSLPQKRGNNNIPTKWTIETK